MIEEAAEAEAAGFDWPMGTFDHDAELVAREGSLLGAMRAKRAINHGGRFNGERVTEMFSGDPDYLTLMDLAENGARIELPPDHVFDFDPPQCEPNSCVCP